MSSKQRMVGSLSSAANSSIDRLLESLLAERLVELRDLLGVGELEAERDADERKPRP